MTPRAPRAPTYGALLGAVIILLSTGLGTAQPAPPSATSAAGDALRARLRTYRQEHEAEVLRELRDLVALPNLARDAPGIAANAARLEEMLGRRGLQTRLLETADSPPAVYGHLVVPGATRTVVFYAHYDGQPVSPGDWSTPAWTPVLRSGTLEAGAPVVPWDRLATPIPGEHRLYGRSTSDDKGPIVAFLAALDAIKASGVQPSVNVKIFLEGEEEAGSPHLSAMLTAHRDLLRADLWIFGDGPVHQTRAPLVSFGVRGTIDVELTTYGPVRAVHSGHYGNWAPNPAVALVQLVASMRDDEGRMTINGVDRAVRPLSAGEQAAIAAQPPVDDAVAAALGLGRREQVRGTLADSLTVPALNLRGLRAGEVGERASNAIPTQAQASIDFRLVPDLTPALIRGLVEAHVRRRGYHIVSDPPDEATLRAHPRVVRLEWGPGYPGYRTSMDLPAARAVVAAVQQAVGGPVVQVPNMGGSLPLYLFADVLQSPVISVPIVNHDNNQHAANENLRLQNLWDGVEIYGVLLARLGPEWDRAEAGRTTPR
ncbi:MAG: M20/M25/M40 family metallo-hydrolase [Acidobacteria bacterium]|nr:M20/M25/M40 family metallo-hydrolase [Acidobacteriota bacterium]